MSRSLSPLRLHLLAPSIAFIVATTMIPTGLRHPSLAYVANGFDAVDVINNIVLYLPFGLVLSGTSLRRALLSGLLLSFAAETLQLGYADRISSLADVTCNTAGALLGFLLGFLLRKTFGIDSRWIRLPRRWTIVGIPIAILSTIALLVHQPRPDFSNWSSTAHFLIGDEVTHNRPWAGSIRALQLYPFAVPPRLLTGLAQTLQSSRQGEKVIAHSFPTGGLLPNLDSSLAYGQPVLSPEQERHLYDALSVSGKMTLLVLARPDNVDQAGPARIVTYSEGPFDRNFTLGQVRAGLTLRLRTPVTGMNGTDPALYTGPVLTPDHTAFLAAIYDGKVSSLYVDGKLVAHQDLGLRRPHLPKRVLARLPGSIPIRVIELSATEMFSSAMLAIGLLALLGVPRTMARRMLWGAAAGIAVAIPIWVVAVSSPGLGVRIVLECIAGGCMFAASLTQES